MKNSFNDLLETLERIRVEKYPDIPAEIIREIAFIQFEHQDNIELRFTKTQKAIDQYITKVKEGSK